MAIKCPEPDCKSEDLWYSSGVMGNSYTCRTCGYQWEEKNNEQINKNVQNKD